MTHPVAVDSLPDWAEALRALLAPHLHQIAYGNLRAQFARWETLEGNVDNLAIAYELPGGSTNQINITYRTTAGMFSYLTLDSCEERQTADFTEVQAMVAELLVHIPALRRTHLQADLRRWAEGGQTQPELFQQVNRLLQKADIPGGAITDEEAAHALAYLTQLRREKTDASAYSVAKDAQSE